MTRLDNEVLRMMETVLETLINLIKKSSRLRTTKRIMLKKKDIKDLPDVKTFS